MKRIRTLAALVALLIAAAGAAAQSPAELVALGDAGHFSLARAAGRRALSAGVRERIRFSRIIREAALAALKIDGTHAGALHVLGMWNAEIMRLSGLSRTFARTFLGADALNLATCTSVRRQS